MQRSILVIFCWYAFFAYLTIGIFNFPHKGFLLFNLHLRVEVLMLKRKEEWFMKKRLALFMAATVLATMLAGCGSSSSSSAGACGQKVGLNTLRKEIEDVFRGTISKSPGGL
jgi:hypothetical protein